MTPVAARNCIGCGSQLAMKPAKLATMPLALRVIGHVVALMAASAVVVAVWFGMVVLRGWAEMDWSDAYFGSPYCAGLGVMAAIALSLIGVVLGWVARQLLARRPVYQCDRCGSVMNRARAAPRRRRFVRGAG